MGFLYLITSGSAVFHTTNPKMEKYLPMLGFTPFYPTYNFLKILHEIKCFYLITTIKDRKVAANVGFHSVLPNLQFFENST